MEKPIISQISKIAFTASWSTPKVQGGCPITSYVLYRDDGAGSSVNIPIDPTTFNDRSSLFSYVVTLDSTFTGKNLNV